jgi:acetoacetyl-CoA synthetase
MGAAAPVLWRPTPEQVAGSRMAAFAARVGLPLDPKDAEAGYERLWAWSTSEREAFWAAVWEDAGILGERGERVLADDAMPGARWFPDARLNFAENLLARRDEAPALVFRGEDGRRREHSFASLAEEVRRLRAQLAAWGVGPRDRVAAFLPNLPEAVVGMLAASSLGAAWSSCSPDFGVDGVLDRFGQVAPKVLLVADGYLYKGKPRLEEEKLEAILAGLPSVEQAVVVPFLGEAGAELRARFLAAPGRHAWDELLAAAPDEPLTFARLPFDHPLYVMFSSGTTGKPKCIVHGQGGTLLQHRKEHRLHVDLRPDERFFYFTTTGWMMWNWLVTGLAEGATVVLYDGNPFHPDPEAMWRLAAEERLAVFGTSAKFIDASKKAGAAPATAGDLSALRAILSTGSPLVDESFDWTYEAVKSDLMLASITGGTDLISCFALGCPVVPVRRGELQRRGLGMAVEVWDDEGRPRVDEPGELVCTRSFPSMPVGFLGDEDGSRYRGAYFEHFPGLWRHGDWVELRASGGMVVYGRSDATLNPGGVRIGTAEIYRQVEQLAEVLEAVVVGQDTGDGDQRVVLFLRLAEGVAFDEALVERLRRRIREHASPRHVPAVVLAVDDIPRTRSGKISEIAVRDTVHGRPVKNTAALANPESLGQFRDRPELA